MSALIADAMPASRCAGSVQSNDSRSVHRDRPSHPPRTAVTKRGRPVRSCRAVTSTNRPVRVKASTVRPEVVSSCSTAQRPTRPQQPGRQADDVVDHRHAVIAAEQCMRRIILSHFGFQLCAGRDVGRIGHQEVDGAVEFAQQAGIGDVGTQQLHGGVADIAPRIRQRVVGVVDGDDPGPGPVAPQRQGQRGGAGTQIHDQRVLRQRLGESPFQQRLGFRPGNEHPGADLHGDRTERRGSGQVLQRHAFCTLADKPFVAFDEVGVGFDQRESAAVGAGHVSGQQFGIGTWGSDAGPGQRLRRSFDRVMQPTGPHRSLPCLGPIVTCSAAWPACRRRRARRTTHPCRPRGPGRGCAP